VRLALAQMNATVGDLRANALKIADLLRAANDAGATVFVTPELALSGYPPEDLLLKEGFLEDVREELAGLGAVRPLGTAYIGAPLTVPDSDGDVEATRDARYGFSAEVARPERVINALAISRHGRCPDGYYAKKALPNYDVFDEDRYFHAGLRHAGLGGRVGLLICEDVWIADGPAKAMADAGAEILVVANASPFAVGRQREREEMLRERAIETGCPIAYVNMVGGQDELVFDGRSVVVDAAGEVIARAGAFEEELLVVDVAVPDGREGHELAARPARVAADLDRLSEVYSALVIGTRDYVRKNGFDRAVVNLSGGIDSSLVTVVAVDALGAGNVRVYAQPSRYSSEHSLEDASELARRCGVEIAVVPIEAAHAALSATLGDALGHPVAGLTDENLQSRIRGVFLMGISNDSGAIVLTTGNKSELATGYSTLYGDSAGGFAVIKDVPKTLVYELSEWRNALAIARGEELPIPERVLTKAPSAELRPDQRDDQSLPPYEVLDPILALYIEGDRTVSQLIEDGFDAELVRRVARLVDLNEYKRRQMPPGVRITKKAFGKDRRMPITNAYRSRPT
jgi:NAD+ synthase (glutamine-hydrolysing)